MLIAGTWQEAYLTAVEKLGVTATFEAVIKQLDKGKLSSPPPHIHIHLVFHFCQ